MNPVVLEKIKHIRALVLDVDGVFTDGHFYLAPNGDEIKCFHTHDGLGLKRLRESGIVVAIISGRKSETVTRRMHDLGIKHVQQGISKKDVAFQQLMQQLNIASHQVAYMGDDLPDLSVMECVGLSIAPANAVDAVKDYADWVTARDGGNAAIREVCDVILSIQAKVTG